MMKRYPIKKLIAGSDVDQDYNGMVLVAVPFGTDHTVMVTHLSGYMIIKKKTKPLTIRTFEDKYGRDKKYRLWYHKWMPTVPRPKTPLLSNTTNEGREKLLQAFKDSKKKKSS